MLLRPRQHTFVERTLAALRDRGNALAVAPTGFGKTVALAAVIGRPLSADDRTLLAIGVVAGLVRQVAGSPPSFFRGAGRREDRRNGHAKTAERTGA